MWPGVKWPQEATYIKRRRNQHLKPQYKRNFWNILVLEVGAGSWKSRIEIFYWVIKGVENYILALNIKRMWPWVKWPQERTYIKVDEIFLKPQKIGSFGIFCCCKGAGFWKSRIEIFYWVIKTNWRSYPGSRYQIENVARGEMTTRSYVNKKKT